jgi:hypothetical protein
VGFYGSFCWIEENSLPSFLAYFAQWKSAFYNLSNKSFEIGGSFFKDANHQELFFPCNSIENQRI